MTYMVGMEVIMKGNVRYESNQIVMNNSRITRLRKYIKFNIKLFKSNGIY